jgi:anti-anti-sigma factor
MAFGPSSPALYIDRDWTMPGVSLRLSGILDLDGSLLLKQAVDTALPAVNSSVVLDCNALTAVDSAGIGALVSLFRSLREHNIKLQLVRLPAKVAELLRITKLDRLLVSDETPPPQPAAMELVQGLMPEGKLLHCWEELQCNNTACEHYGQSGYICWSGRGARHAHDGVAEEDLILECFKCRVYRNNVNYLGQVQEHFEQYVQEAEAAFKRLRAERDSLGHELGKTRALLSAAMEQAVDYVFAADAAGRVVLWNPALAGLTGNTSAEVADLSAAVRTLLPGGGPLVWQFMDFIEGRTSEALYETEVRDRLNQLHLISWSRQLVSDSAGQALGLLAMGRDVTAVRHAEQALRDYEERQRYVTENIAEGLALVIEDRIAYANPALATLSGRLEGELEGLSFDELFDPSRRESVAGFMQDQRSAREVLRYQSVLLTHSGEQVHVEVTQAPSQYRDQPAQIVMLRDASARRRLLAYERLIPICSGCGAIRDDSINGAGNGGWYNLEQFLQTTVERTLTHTLCPECVEQMRRQTLELIPIEGD